MAYKIDFNPDFDSAYTLDVEVVGKHDNFFAINFEMKEQFEMFYDKEYNTKSIYKDANGMTKRSEITPIYAKNFYKRFIEGKV